MTHRLVDVSEMTDSANGVDTVLVFRIGQLGDSLVALPAIGEIRKRHPAARMVLLTEQQLLPGHVSSWDVYGPTGWFKDVVFYRPAVSAWQRLMTLVSLTWRLRRLRCRLVYDLTPQRTARQSGRDRFFFQRVVGIPNYCGGGQFSKPPKVDGASLPRIEPEWRRLLRAAGASENTAVVLPVPKADSQAAQSLLSKFGLGDGASLIAVGLGSKMPAKRWPLERFRELGQRLLDKHPDVHLVIVGGADDTALGEQLCLEWRTRSHNVAGRLSAYGSAEVLRRCVAYVGNDTGAMHLAGMVGTPCVALFSARDYPGQWEPYGQGHVVLRHEVECAGCMLEVCPYQNKCLALIETEEAFMALESVIASRRASTRGAR